MIRWSLSVLLIFCVQSFCLAQRFVGKTKKEVLKTWNRSNDSAKFVVEQFSDRIAINTHDPKFKPIDRNYYFKKDICVAEEVIAYCDTCYRLYVDAILRDKNIYWMRISDKLWLSDYQHQLQLELYPDKNYAYVVRRIRLSPSEYRAISGGAIW